MGKYGIGARVQDWAGDTATIIGKRKGERQVRYDNPLYCQDGWFDKDSFTVIDEPTTASAPVEQWVPKVGDRVIWAGKWNPSMYTAGKEYLVHKERGSTLYVTDDTDEQNHSWDVESIRQNFTLVEPEPALEEKAAVPPAPDFKIGDRVNWTRVRGEFDGSIIEEYDGGFYDFKLRATNGNHTYAFKHEVEAAPFTIEAGKFYRTRDGRKVGPVVHEPWHDPQPWSAADGNYNRFYNEDGNWFGDGTEHVNDLVAEWVEEPIVAVEAVEPQPKFKVGDRVRIARNSRGHDWLDKHIGDEVVIKAEDGYDECPGWSFENHGWWWPTVDLDPVTPSSVTLTLTVANENIADALRTLADNLAA
jgi:hypothetical protein